jgi:hypothetical protein
LWLVASLPDERIASRPTEIKARPDGISPFDSELAFRHIADKGESIMQANEKIVIERDGETAVADSGFGRSPMDALYDLLVIEGHNDAVFGQIMQMMIRRAKA